MSKIGITIKIFRQGQFNQLNILGKFPVNEKEPIWLFQILEMEK